MSTLRVGMLTQYYPPEVGAPQARLSDLAAALQRRGHQVTVLTAMPNYPAGRVHAGYGGLVRRESRDGVPVIRTALYPTQRADRLHRLTSYLSFVASSAVVGSALLPPVDVLLTESPPLFLGLAGLWLSRLKRARLIFNVSDIWPESALRLGLLTEGGAAHRASARLEAECYQRAWLVSGQSREIVQDVARRFPTCRTYHLSNGVDSSFFTPAAREAAARARLGGPAGCVVLYAGLHGLAQGLAQLLRAAAALRHRDDVRFVLVGDGPEKAALMAQAAEARLTNVAFLAAEPRAAMPALVASADIVVVPLRTHIPGAVPSKLYEAMSSGTPVVLAAHGEGAEILRQHEAGLVVPPDDHDALAHAVARLADDGALRARFGANGRRAAVEHYDRRMIGERFGAYLEQHVVEPRVVHGAAQPGTSVAS